MQPHRMLMGAAALSLSLAAAPARAQDIAQVLADAGRTIPWAQNAGVTGGIPNRTQICATLHPGATVAQINAAIAACTNGVVYLSAGNYPLSSGIDFAGRSNVTLRGAGPTQTVLQFTGSIGCDGPIGAHICIEGPNVGPGTSIPADQIVDWTDGYAQGTTQITVASAAGIAPGQIVLLDQLDDSSDTGGVTVCGQTQGFCSEEGSGGNGRTGRSQAQMVQVTAVNGTTLTLSPGLYMTNWRSSQSPQLWWVGTPDQIPQMDGVEDLTLDHTGDPAATSGIDFINAYNGWVKNVRSILANRNHVWSWQSGKIQVQDSYFYGTVNAQIESYGFEAGFLSSDALGQNNIFQHIVGPYITAGCSGCAFLYTYADDEYFTACSGWQLAAMEPHSGGDNTLLFEGNSTDEINLDTDHGPALVNTLWRNWLTGQAFCYYGVDALCMFGTNAVTIQGLNRGTTAVGNVLGTPGYHTVYEDSPGPEGQTGMCNTAIYNLGYGGSCEGEAAGMTPDALTPTTLVRWGNYDAVGNAARFEAGEVDPAGAVPYLSAVAAPATQTLPASLFFAAQPSPWWSTPWGTPPWPPIGPDVSGGPGPGGHAWAIPAQLCAKNTPIDPTYSVDAGTGVLLFDAANCYGVSGAAASTSSGTSSAGSATTATNGSATSAGAGTSGGSHLTTSSSTSASTATASTTATSAGTGSGTGGTAGAASTGSMGTAGETGTGCGCGTGSSRGLAGLPLWILALALRGRGRLRRGNAPPH